MVLTSHLAKQGFAELPALLPPSRRWLSPPRSPRSSLHGARFIRRAAGEELLSGGDGGAAHP